MSADFLNELFGLNGQTAVVIGGTGVLGGALAEGLARAGARVIVAGRNEERGKARVAAIAAFDGEARYVSTDATNRASVESLLQAAIAWRGGADILVNCAGVNSAAPYEEISDEDWRRITDGNLFSTHLGCQIFAPHMAARPGGGAILNIGSVTAHLPLSKVFAYAASKAAVVNYTKNVAREYGQRKVRINALCPGFFPAEQNRKILDASRTASVMSQTPMNRFGEPHELVGAMLLLVSRGAGSFITGADVYVDGGFTGMRL